MSAGAETISGDASRRPARKKTWRSSTRRRPRAGACHGAFMRPGYTNPQLSPSSVFGSSQNNVPWRSCAPGAQGRACAGAETIAGDASCRAAGKDYGSPPRAFSSAPGLAGRVDAVRMQNAAAVAEGVWLAPRRRMCGGAFARSRHRSQWATALRKPRATPVASPREKKELARINLGAYICFGTLIWPGYTIPLLSPSSFGWFLAERCAVAIMRSGTTGPSAPRRRDTRGRRQSLDRAKKKNRPTSTRVEPGAYASPGTLIQPVYTNRQLLPRSLGWLPANNARWCYSAPGPQDPARARAAITADGATRGPARGKTGSPARASSSAPMLVSAHSCGPDIRSRGSHRALLVGSLQNDVRSQYCAPGPQDLLCARAGTCGNMLSPALVCERPLFPGERPSTVSVMYQQR